jgi:hypothetical protein
VTTVAKLSSVSAIVEASRATSVPLLPIAMPMSARRSAGASFTPSPVIATISPCSRSRSAIRSFASGELRAKTRWRFEASSSAERGVARAVELGARDDANAVRDDAGTPGDRRAGRAGVAGDHDDPDPRPPAARDRVRNLGPRRVEQRDQADEDQSALDLLALAGGLDRRERPHRDRQHAQPLGRPVVGEPPQ